MNTKYKHTLKYLQEQKDLAYVKGKRENQRKSIAIGFAVGVLLAGLVHLFGGKFF